jgi:MoxR-like ATPase
MASYLEKTGIVGIAAIEDPILAGLVLGEPILLVGPPGCAKTAFIERLSHLMGYKEDDIAAYSAPTVNFEDVVGLPWPTETVVQNPDGSTTKKVTVEQKSSFMG